MTPPPPVIGVDGGGTRSRLAVAIPGGPVIARAEGGSTNPYSVPREEAHANLRALIERGLAAAGIRPDRLSACCVGSAGLGREVDRAALRRFLDGLLPPGVTKILCTDGEILLCGGLHAMEGYCLIAGTGSLALGRDAGGALTRAGGAGYLLGDEGAAAWIGRTAVARSLRALEGRDLPSRLMPALLDAAGLAAPADFVAWTRHDAGKAEVAALAPVVTAAARDGDALALDILHAGAAELVLLVESVVARSPGVRNRELVTAGGVFEHDEIVGGRFRALLAERLPGLALVEARGTAVEGACMLAAAPPPLSSPA